MGVPAFFRWLSRKYVSIIVDAVEEKNRDSKGDPVWVDATQPNLNYQEFDNLYLDMNGIIHPCTHPEDRPAPKTEDEMFVLIFQYIDRLFSIVRPRRVLYMAVDGVAPRAKMNQQRSRRFRAAKEGADKKLQIQEIRRKLESEGVPLPPPKKKEEEFDSNCITPGTPFMARLSTALRYYIHKRVTSDPAWQKIQVLLSDASAPGEGEHKIMDYIRKQRALPSHDPNTVHCLCGADADLIMLGLATHEVNFNIIREEFVPNQPRACELCGQYGHELEHCQGLAKSEASADQADPLKKGKNFIFIRLPVLREYLERELTMPNLPFGFDLERAIDDWVFMCFFVGNDFLPHLPSLEIREGAIDRLIKLYKEMVYDTGGWLTESGEVILERVKIIMIGLGKVEDEIFKTRQFKEQRYRENQRNNRRRARQASNSALMPYNASLIAPYKKAPEYLSGEEIRKLASKDRMMLHDENQRMQAASDRLRAIMIPSGVKRSAPPPTDSDSDAPPKAKDGHEKEFQNSKTHLVTSSAEQPPPVPLISKESHQPIARASVQEDSDVDEPVDGIRLWEDGWKERYYQAKFSVSENNFEFRKNVACSYVEGLCWVLKYYYQGCASWTWYYPFHYAPFASDFELIGDFKPDFDQNTKPFKPLEQLMAVFPAASRSHIPEAWQHLMTNKDSPIIDFYPEDFEIDLNGKKYAWQGVALLPFVDEKRLLSALETVYSKLTNEENERNMRGPDRLFIGKDHQLFQMLNSVVKGDVTEENKLEEKNYEENKIDYETWTHIDGNLSCGMSGLFKADKTAIEFGAYHISQFKGSLEFGDIKQNTCIMVEYSDPHFPEGHKFASNRLVGVTELPRVLKPKDFDERQRGPWRPQIGFSRDIPRANLSSTGHRLLNHEIWRPQTGFRGDAHSPRANHLSTNRHQLPNQPLWWRPPPPIGFSDIARANFYPLDHRLPNHEVWRPSIVYGGDIHPSNFYSTDHRLPNHDVWRHQIGFGGDNGRANSYQPRLRLPNHEAWRSQAGFRGDIPRANHSSGHHHQPNPYSNQPSNYEIQQQKFRHQKKRH